jgi:hypothetical protein
MTVHDPLAAKRANAARRGCELSLIVPVKDEEAAIEPFLARVSPILERLLPDDGGAARWEILFVDDGSTDATMSDAFWQKPSSGRSTSFASASDWTIKWLKTSRWNAPFSIAWRNRTARIGGSPPGARSCRT